MIYNQWYIILESKELGKHHLLRVKRLNEDLAIWRDEKGQVCIISDRCCHRGASLSCGKIIDGRLECPFHGFIYDKSGKITVIPANGKNQPVPANMKVKAYKSFERFGFIWMFWGDEDKITGEPFFFKELGNFPYSSFKDHWNVHYSRAIENQLDVVHLPFVHRTTIGKGNKTLVNGPVVVRDGELITFYVNNVFDDEKTIPKRPEEITGYEHYFHLQFHFPNIWQNFIADRIRATAAFVPVDEENSIIYIRYYQNLVRIPILKELFLWIGKISSIIILRQDKRIVVTQKPKKSQFRMDEQLIIGDKPIIEYRRHRQELIDLNNKPEK